jgi:hypothetical protein
MLTWMQQPVHVALRFYYMEDYQANWTHIIPPLQRSLKGACSTGTGASAHEFIYGLYPKRALDAID